MQFALDLAKRERVQGSWVFAEGQALNPPPYLDVCTAFQNKTRNKEGWYKRIGDLNGWIYANERHLEKIQSVALDLAFLYCLLACERYEDVKINRPPDRRFR